MYYREPKFMLKIDKTRRSMVLVVLVSVCMTVLCVGGLRIRAQNVENAEQLSKMTERFDDKEPNIFALNSSQIDILGPVGSGHFGARATPLPNGNIVVLDPLYDAPGAVDAGAFHLYDGTTGVLISTLTGNTPNGGVGGVITVLANGNYVVSSGGWDDGNVLNVGAHTWCSATTGCSGVISSANSLIGTTASDSVGAVTVALNNGNYVVISQLWDNGGVANAGAVTWCSGTTGCTGTINSTNSLVGTTTSALNLSAVGLANGNYVVRHQGWSGTATSAGAVRLCSGSSGCNGTITSANSLVGSTAQDQVGQLVNPLANGNYVVRSRMWDGAAADVGAVTFCNGTTGCTGTVSSSNSLVGTTLNDQAGGSTGMVELTNGGYVVATRLWNGAAADVGAVTFCNGTTGCTGAISSANSLVGTALNDQVGSGVSVALTNGNYVVASPLWNGAAADVGAVTWCSGTTGCTGPVTAGNSLIGSSTGDNVGGGTGITFGVLSLPNGNYAAVSSQWDGAFADVGAVTFCNGATGTTGVVSAGNSLTGSSTNDQIGRFTVALANSDYIVISSLWDGASPDVGAVTKCNGTTGCVGTVSASNSLVGSTSGDQVGSGRFVELTNGNYVVTSPLWDGIAVDTGAATWCRGTTSCTGAVSASNSIVGSTAGDKVGQEDPDNVGIGNANLAALPNGDYYFGSGKWDNGGIVDAGAVTYGNGITGTVGTINSQNSVLGTAANRGPWLAAAYSTFLQKLIVGRDGSNLFTIYTPDASSVDVSGRILTSGGRGVRGAVVRLNDGPTVVRTVTTDAYGKYRFLSIAPGHSYTITATQRRFTFAPRPVNPSGNLTDIDITASP